jgi:dihydroxy-acid dehydratase
MVGFRTAVPGVSDNIGMGHEGMFYSLPSRDIIADALEMNIQAHRYDAAILIPS